MKGSVTSIRVFEVFFFCFSFTLLFFAIFAISFFFFFASHPPPFCFSPAEFSTDFCLIFCFPFFSLSPLSISVSSYSFFFLSPLFLLRSTLGKTVIKHYDIEIEAYTGALCDFICNSSIHFSYLSFYLNNCKS